MVVVVVVVQVAAMDEDELFVFAKHIQAPFSLVQEVAKTGRLPVVNFAAGGIATPADAALMMQLGVDGETGAPSHDTFTHPALNEARATNLKSDTTPACTTFLPCSPLFLRALRRRC